jgi:putative tryptophan/tyrosine transport system substrate-binding protein
MEWALVAARRTFFALCICIAQWLLAGVSMAQNIALVMSENTAAYLEIADAVKRNVSEQGASKLKIFSMPVDDLAVGDSEIYKTDFYRLVVTIGARAAGVVAKLQVKPPVLSTMIPRSLFERLPPRQGGEQTSAIYLDQPLERQLTFIRLLLPNKNRLGVAYGPNSASVREDLERVAKLMGYNVVSENLESMGNLGPTFNRILARADFLIELPDAEIYNPTTIPKILLSSYHANRPVISYSAAHVKSGALAAMFTPPQSLAQQIAEFLVKQQASSKFVLPAPQYPAYWRISINRQVARSLKLNIGSEQEIEDSLNQIAENSR